MVDSNDRERLIEAREELERMTQEEELRDSILLVFANKQDLPSACSVGEVADALGLQSMRNRQVNVVQASGSLLTFQECPRLSLKKREVFHWTYFNKIGLEEGQPAGEDLVHHFTTKPSVY